MLQTGRGLEGRVRLRTAALALLVVSAVSGVLAAGADAVPGNFWGVAPQAAPSADQYQRLKRGGVDSVRIPIEWGAIQAGRDGGFNWNGTDELVGGAAAAGIEIFPFLTGAPTWAVKQAVVNRAAHAKAPQNLPVRNHVQKSGWTTFVGEAVRRYGPHGAFWAANPAVPYRPVRVWQIWNEPNFKYFVARPNPAEYGKLVKLSTPVIKRIDHGAKIVLAGLFAAPKEAAYKRRPPQAYYATDFIRQLYRRTPGIKSKFDGVALHPYTYEFKEIAGYVEELREVLKSSHDPGVGLWITELGWSAGRPNKSNGHNGFEKGPKGQAAQLKGAFRMLRAKQRKWRVKQVFWFSVDDRPGACNFCDGSGLFGPGFVARPSWRAYVKFAGGKAG
jgi:polysaccharide biosynthesis protein PslG